LAPAFGRNGPRNHAHDDAEPGGGDPEPDQKATNVKVYRTAGGRHDQQTRRIGQACRDQHAPGPVSVGYHADERLTDAPYDIFLQGKGRKLKSRARSLA
jgi:hypothetical protein